MRDSQLAAAVLLAGLMIAAVAPVAAIITRHDVKDDKYTWNGREFLQQACHLPYPGCGAVLVAPRWILTAGHCVYDFVPGTSVKIAGKICPADTAIVHPDREDGVDLALLHLVKPIRHTKPVYVYRGNDELGKEIIITGHGYKGTGLTGTDKEDHQFRAATNVVDGVNDRWVMFTFDQPGSGGVTELEGVGGPGDTGGPALLKMGGVMYTLGVNAWQKNTGIGLMPGHYGVKPHYVRISKYVEWIESELEKYGDKLPVPKNG